MKLLGRAKSEITKDRNVENVRHLENNEVVLIHRNIINRNYQQDSRVLYTFFPNKLWSQLLDTSPNNFIFLKTLIRKFHILKYGLLIKILNC